MLSKNLIKKIKPEKIDPIIKSFLGWLDFLGQA